MPKVSSYTRKRIQALDEFGLQPIAIFKQLVDEGLRVSYPSVARIVNKVKLTGSINAFCLYLLMTSSRFGAPHPCRCLCESCF